MTFYQNPWLASLAAVVAFSPIAFALSLAARGELAARAGRHRGVYVAPKLTPSVPQVGETVVLGEYLINTPVWGVEMVDDPTATAYITLTPEGGCLSLPALLGAGEPPPVLTFEDFERINADAIGRQRQERIAEINSVIHQHERVYHPVNVTPGTGVVTLQQPA